MILNRIEEQGVITVAEICTYCDCSPETARRDLRRLEEQTLITRTHGGAKRRYDNRTAPHAQLDLGSLLKARVAIVDRVDALIVTSSETASSNLLTNQALSAGVPVIAEGRHCAGATTAVVIDNYQAGVELGRWVAAYVKRNFSGRAAVLDVGFPGSSTEARSRGFADGLSELVRRGGAIYHVNGQGSGYIAYHRAADALSVHPDINVIMGVNDVSAMAALDAFRAAGLDDSQLLVVSFGLEDDDMREALLQDGPLKACLSLFPELVGRACIDAALCAIQNIPLPEHILPPSAILTADNLLDYYDYHENDGGWELRLDRANSLPNVSPQYLLLSQGPTFGGEATIGYVQNFSSHGYYRSLLRTMQSHARHKRLGIESIDASQDAAQEKRRLKSRIGVAAAQVVHEGDTIILDAGDTVQSLARALRDRRDITVITNSLLVVQELADRPNINLIVSGGLYHYGARSFIGPHSEATLRDLRADKAFIGTTGVSIEFGLSNSNLDEAVVKRLMMEAAREVILLADHDKIGVDSLVKVAPINSIHRLVTSAGISERDLQSFQDHNIDVIVADDLYVA